MTWWTRCRWVASRWRAGSRRRGGRWRARSRMGRRGARTTRGRASLTRLAAPAFTGGWRRAKRRCPSMAVSTRRRWVDFGHAALCSVYIKLEGCFGRGQKHSWVVTWIWNKIDWRLEYDCVTNSMNWMWIWLGSSKTKWLIYWLEYDWLEYDYDLTIFQLRLSIGRVHACAISSWKLVFLKLNGTLFWNVLY